MQAIEMMEDRVPCVATLKRDLPIIICEEQMDISFMESPEVEAIAKSLCSTEVGEVREHFTHHLKRCMFAELCGDVVGESIFESGSQMGLQLEETEDHWMRGETSATWTRVIVVPRKSPYHPEEEGLSGPLRTNSYRA